MTSPASTKPYEQLVEARDLRAGDFLYRLEEHRGGRALRSPRDRGAWVLFPAQSVRARIASVDQDAGVATTRSGALLDLGCKDRPAVIATRKDES